MRDQDNNSVFDLSMETSYFLFVCLERGGGNTTSWAFGLTLCVTVPMGLDAETGWLANRGKHFWGGSLLKAAPASLSELVLYKERGMDM